MSATKPVGLIYPIVFFGGVLFLCAWYLNGNRIFAPFVPAEQHTTERE
jgi:hypothetical protein